MVQMEIPQVEEFLIRIQKSWEQATKAIEEAQKSIKKQFDKKRRNPQGLKDTDLLGSQKTLVQERFNWNFQKDG